MDTTTLLKKAWNAVVKSGVPPKMEDAAFKAAIEHLSGPQAASDSPPPLPPDGGEAKATKREATRKRTAAGKQSGTTNGGSSSDLVLSQMPEDDDFFVAVSKETGVLESDLRDVFHITDGQLELKVASKDLGANTKAATNTVTSLLVGAVFAGTGHKSLPVSEVHDVCRTKRCHGDTNASKYVRSTPSVAAVGSGASSALTHKSGWQGEFAKAVDRVLGRQADDA